MLVFNTSMVSPTPVNTSDIVPAVELKLVSIESTESSVSDMLDIISFICGTTWFWYVSFIDWTVVESFEITPRRASVVWAVVSEALAAERLSMIDCERSSIICKLLSTRSADGVWASILSAATSFILPARLSILS